MIKSVTVKNSKNESLVIELANPLSSGFAITDISGIGPVQATINTTKYATRDGSLFSSARVDERNIVMSIMFLAGENESIENVRHRSYQFFSVKDNITLTIKTDDRNCEIAGYVESNEPTIFSRYESTQISIICPDPYFYDYTNQQTISFIEIERLFHFPFYNDGADTRTVKFGTITHHKTKTFNYKGEGRSGIYMCVNIQDQPPGNKITIGNNTTGQKMVINTALAAESNTTFAKQTYTKLWIKTIPGNKYVRLGWTNTDGTQYSGDILYCLESGSEWLEVVHGENEIVIENDGESETVNAWLEAPIKYEGI